ncbi:protein-L-isoaspartate O-methyltransferase [Rhodoferax sp.]|jgi:protein-L-isoaspartate(D-aspartate) O-methyltransferase|uniref:protein-L-isoaspartate O-methyltransferase n=1 Tax=Rhodoferax sp. TaxID=50421 RepID=UPI0037840A76
MTMTPTEQARFNMIEQQVRPWNVTDAAVLESLSLVKRELFVPKAYQSLAFADMEIPLGHGQSMLAPRLEARLLQDLAVQASDKVLEVGTGSGYMAALLGRLAQRVLSLEIQPELLALARANLQGAGIGNVDVRQADGCEGAAADGPFDVILLSGSVAEVPAALLGQLKPGGRLAAIVGDEPIMAATLITRTGMGTSKGDFHTSRPWDTVAPRLLHFPEPTRFHF